MPGPRQEMGTDTPIDQTPRLHKMSEWLVPVIMGAQAVALALISRLRWRCFPDPETGRCTMVSGCTEHALQESGGIDAQEFTISDQKVLLVSGRIN